VTTVSVLAPQPRAEIITVTPELARKWLEANKANRRLRRRDVANYARDMAAGRWLMNGEAVKFDTADLLLDGQHRLHAVITAGVPVPMLVIFGLPRETQATMDAGLKRTTGDAFSLRGETNSTVLAAVLRKVWMWDQGDVKFTANYAPTTAECAAVLEERPEIHRSVEIAVRTHQAFPYIPQSVTGAAHHVFGRIARDETVWFFARVGDGAELPSGHPVLTLRSRVLSERADHKTIPAYRHMAYLIRTWNAVREERALTRIQQAPDAPMPMPK
jgi:hypothetical protein